MVKVTVNDCFYEIKNGANIKQGIIDGGYPITRIETLSNGVFNRDKVGYAGITDIDKYSDYILEDGDLLMSHINSVQYLGRTVIYKRNEGENIIHGMNLLRLRPRKDLVYPKYISYLFAGHKFRESISRITKKSVNQASFAVSDLKKIIINLPDISEQIVISRKFERIEKVIEKRNYELILLDNLIRSRFIEMFGDPINNSKGLPTTNFINVVTLQRGFDLPVQDRNRDGDIPVFGSNGILDRHDVAKIKDGGVITGRSGTIGNVYYTLGSYWPLNTSLFSIDLHGNNVIYLAWLLKLYDLSRFADGTGVPTLNRNNVHNQKIIMVDIQQQQQFAVFVQQINNLKTAIQKNIDEIRVLFESLMQKYFE